MNLSIKLLLSTYRIGDVPQGTFERSALRDRLIYKRMYRNLKEDITPVEAQRWGEVIY
ncbi:hypothetical protein G7B40_003520 [Aetokthonos hydrillicola Thurmond2011]|uniref:Uncharacterized protein n=1 Tax=Aetokthonos hydrillicola Thurmond2011 TaxID=2712845 RepID=A0AAP5I4M1_9CYAN|nr:hypothetical protein [Aetokthonos hydrillicola Thurmond2011]